MNRYIPHHLDHERERAASLVEYVLLFSLIVLICIASLTTFGGGVSDNVNDSANRVVAAT